MESKWVQQAGLEYDEIAIKGLRGNGWLGWVKAPLNVTKAWWQARKVIKRQSPDLVLGMGGFVCGPGGLAARSLGIGLVLHEQNAIAGLTNKLLAPLALRVFCAFPTQDLRGPKVQVVGNPVRKGLEQLTTLGKKSECHLLVLGGSRGALALNETLPKALALLSPDERPTVVHQSGEKTFEQALLAYRQAGVTAQVVPFIDDMVGAYASADLVLCRSGALTVSELMAAARPAIMVPYPHAVDDHQSANAQALVNLGGGEVLKQSELTPERLASALRHWCDPEQREKASHAIRQGAPTRATEKMVDSLLALAANA
jgi:UDP-N-acetylglucosamine--N-acetylmuramyl-(pentapeptide) pyrophosphoryl-undecaprenol N-acetylglucosamine transferase